MNALPAFEAAVELQQIRWTSYNGDTLTAGVLTLNLRCSTWRQVDNIYKNDLSRNGFFMKASKPPPLGTQVKINLGLPSQSSVAFTGKVSAHVPHGGLGGRGPGLDIALDPVSQSTMWLIENGLASAAKNEAAAAPKEQSPEMEDGHAAAGAEAGLLEAMEGELKSLKRFDHFQILEIGHQASNDDVRKAFAELSKKYHPDKFARYQSVRAKELASEIFLHIRDAYLALGTQEGRDKVLSQIRIKKQVASLGPVSAGVAKSLSNVPDGQVSTRAGGGAKRVPVSRGTLKMPAPPPVPQPVASQTSSSRGSGLRDPEGLRLLEAGDFEQALRIFALATRKNPADNYARAGVELAEGLKALAEGDRMEAAQRFEAVLDFDPSNPMAARELAKMRRQSTNDRRGALSNLLKRMNTT